MKRYLTIFGTLLCFACNNDDKSGQSEKDSPLPVRIQTVASTSVGTGINLSGSIEGSSTVKLAFLVPGKIDFISSKKGQFISKGQLLSSLEPTSYSLAKQLADVKLSSTADEFGRFQLMHNKGSVSESDFKKISFALQEAQLQQKVQGKNLSDTKLYSPISGVLLDKQAETGEVISAGIPLFTVADISKVFVSVFVPESELHNIRIGQIAQVNVLAIGKTFNGKVTEVGSIADPSSRAFTIKIEVENPDMLIRPGMVAEARIAVASSRTGIIIPTESVMHGLDNQSYVFVADIARNKAFKRKISLGNITENKIEIVTGLSAGETVVTGGQEKLTDGSSITIVK